VLAGVRFEGGAAARIALEPQLRHRGRIFAFWAFYRVIEGQILGDRSEIRIMFQLLQLIERKLRGPSWPQSLMGMSVVADVRRLGNISHGTTMI
jgi:hypothetical protein